AKGERRADYCFEKALMLAPQDWFIAWLAARIRIFYEQLALGLHLLQQALEWNAGHWVLWLELGRCQQTLGLIGAARTSLTQARQLNPQGRAAEEALKQLSGMGVWRRASGWWRRVFKPCS